MHFILSDNILVTGTLNSFEAADDCHQFTSRRNIKPYEDGKIFKDRI